ncbi:MAG: hypothetical protein OHK0039_18590 [Bacteroidia bacterium]
MRSFLRTCLLFGLPLFVAWLLLFALPVDPLFAGRQYLQRHCRNGNWLIDRLYRSEVPIDVALLGSSQMMCGVSDADLEQRLHAADLSALHVANLGFCRYGRTLHATLTDVLLARGQTRYLIVEVRDREDRFSHPDFPYLAPGGDVLLPYPVVHQRYVEQVVAATGYRFQALRHRLLGLPLPPDSQVHGPHSFALSGVALDILPQDRDLPKRALVPPRSGWQLDAAFPLHYLRRLATRARAQQVEVIFLYLPDYQRPREQVPIEIETYQSLGRVWLPPEGLLDDVSCWADAVHLNERGAARLTAWVAAQLTALYRETVPTP